MGLVSFTTSQGPRSQVPGQLESFKKRRAGTVRHLGTCFCSVTGVDRRHPYTSERATGRKEQNNQENLLSILFAEALSRVSQLPSSTAALSVERLDLSVQGIHHGFRGGASRQRRIANRISARLSREGLQILVVLSTMLESLPDARHRGGGEEFEVCIICHEQRTECIVSWTQFGHRTTHNSTVLHL